MGKAKGFATAMNVEAMDEREREREVNDDVDEAAETDEPYRRLFTLRRFF